MKYLIVAVMAAVVASCNSADTKAVNTKQDSLNRVALSDSGNFSSIQWIDSTFQDLGKIGAGQMVDISWRLKNTGTKPLVIADVRPGCGCTVADKPTEPIAPGEEGTIRAKFDSKGQSEGEHRKNVTVLANTKEGTYMLSFRVDVTKK